MSNPLLALLNRGPLASASPPPSQSQPPASDAATRPEQASDAPSPAAAGGPVQPIAATSPVASPDASHPATPTNAQSLLASLLGVRASPASSTPPTSAALGGPEAASSGFPPTVRASPGNDEVSTQPRGQGDAGAGPNGGIPSTSSAKDLLALLSGGPAPGGGTSGEGSAVAPPDTDLEPKDDAAGEHSRADLTGSAADGPLAHVDGRLAHVDGAGQAETDKRNAPSPQASPAVEVKEEGARAPDAPPTAPASRSTPAVSFDFASPFDFLQSSHAARDEKRSADAASLPKPQPSAQDTPQGVPDRQGEASPEAGGAVEPVVAVPEPARGDTPGASLLALLQPKARDVQASGSGQASNGRPTVPSVPSAPEQAAPAAQEELKPRPGSAHPKGLPEQMPPAAAAVPPKSAISAYRDLQASGFTIASPPPTVECQDRLRCTRLDLRAVEPAGEGSLYRAKLEVTPITLYKMTKFAPTLRYSAGGDAETVEWAASKVIAFDSVVLYAMIKGRARVLNTVTGTRELIALPPPYASQGIGCIRKLSTHASDAGAHCHVAVVVADGSAALVYRIDRRTLQSELLHVFGAPVLDVVGVPDGKGRGEPDVLVAGPDGMYDAGNPERTQLFEWGSDASRACCASETGGVISVSARENPNGGTSAISIRHHLLDERHSKVLRVDAATVDAPTLLPREVDVHAPIVVHSLSRHDVLVGFNRCTCLGIFNMQAKAWTEVIGLEGGYPDASSFGLIHVDHAQGRLLLASSSRSSVFTVPLADLCCHPGSGAASRTPLRIREAALQETPTSWDVVEDGQGGSRLFFAYKEGIQVANLPAQAQVAVASIPSGSQGAGRARVESGGERKLPTEGARFSAPPVQGGAKETAQGPDQAAHATKSATKGIIESKSRLGNVDRSSASTVTQRVPTPESKPKPVPSKVEGGSTRSASPQVATPSSRTTPLPRSVEGSEQSGKGKATPRAAASPGVAPESRQEKKAKASQRRAKETLAAEEPPHADGSPAVVDHGLKRSLQQLEASVEHVSNAELRRALQDVQDRLLRELQESKAARAVASLPASGTSAGTSSPTPIPAPQLSAKDIKSIVSSAMPSLSQQVREAVDDQIKLGVVQAMTQALPAELHKLLLRGEVVAHLSKGLTAAILPPVQRTAMEVVTQAVAPHFEEVMSGLTERVEQTIVAELTSVRKELVAEQGQALLQSEASLRDLVKDVGNLSAQIESQARSMKRIESALSDLRRSESARAERQDVREVWSADRGAGDASASAPASIAKAAAYRQAIGSPMTPSRMQTSLHGSSITSPMAGLGGTVHMSRPMTQHPSMPSASNYLLATTADEAQHVEDALLSALSAPDIDVNLGPLTRVLLGLEARFGSPTLALWRLQPYGGDVARVSQPVILATFHRLATAFSTGLGAGAGGTSHCPSAETTLSWLEALAKALDASDETIAPVLAHIRPSLREQLLRGVLRVGRGVSGEAIGGGGSALGTMRDEAWVLQSAQRLDHILFELFEKPSHP